VVGALFAPITLCLATVAENEPKKGITIVRKSTIRQKNLVGKNAGGRGVIKKGFALPVITSRFDFLANGFFKRV